MSMAVRMRMRIRSSWSPRDLCAERCLCRTFFLAIHRRPRQRGGASRLPACQSVVMASVPVIDIGGLDTRGGLASIGSALDLACRDTGFFVVVGHGIRAGLFTE